MPDTSETDPAPETKEPNTGSNLRNLLTEVLGDDPGTIDAWEAKLNHRYVVGHISAINSLTVEIIAAIVRREKVGIRFTLTDLLVAFQMVVSATQDDTDESQKEFLQVLRGIGIALAEGKFNRGKGRRKDGSDPAGVPLYQ